MVKPKTSSIPVNSFTSVLKKQDIQVILMDKSLVYILNLLILQTVG